MSKVNIQSLRNKLNRLGNSDTGTLEIKDPKEWIELIQSRGNKPKDWLDFMRYMTTKAHSSDEFKHHNYLSDLYETAFDKIPRDENKGNIFYGALFVEFAQMKSKFQPDEADDLFNCARRVVRKLAIVHIAHAEYELSKGNVSKSRKILEKARQFEAEPDHLLTEAFQRLDAGQTNLQTSSILAECATVSGNKSSTSSTESTGDLRNLTGNLTSSSLTGGLTNSNLTGGVFRPSHVGGKADPSQSTPAISRTNTETPLCHPHNFKKPESIPMDHDMEMDTAPISHRLTSHPNPSKLSMSAKPVMRKAHSTPELRGASSSKAMLKPKTCLLPQRVKKLNLPFSELSEKEEDEDGENGFPSFTPLDGQSFTGLMGSQAHTSGYMTMTNSYTTPHRKDISPLKEVPHREPLKPIQNEARLQVEVDPVMITSQEKGPLLTVPSPKHVSPPVRSPVTEPPKNVNPPKQKSPTVEPPKKISEVKPSQNENVKNNPVAEESVKKPSPKVPTMETMYVNGKLYQVLQCVGHGGSSKVYTVIDHSGQNPQILALKVVRLEDQNKQIIEGYKNEIQLLKRLQYCPKVITLHDFEYKESENLLYILMECGELDFDKYLKDTIKQEGHLSPLYIKFYWHSMLQAVGALHKEGIIHSDLKPSNFLLRHGNLKLIDFGISKAIQQDKTSIITDTQVGTLNYMSPESIREHCGYTDEDSHKPVFKINVKSDVWSLGCILYCMVYGHTPFQKVVRQIAKLHAIINPEYEIKFPEIQDKKLMDVMKKCLNRDPKERPSIEELLKHEYLHSL
ncbi:dual specificity protein kinase Ttk-like [Saccostrea echinata]|uniref:dual specificity protein kinase Ttk-like n=1 Tax=Saccostrea echinata TaxID=191078 RepID=UPI002A81C98A|nr:dual specificity protein kinase Ttk-like [Saccostrea echinata]